MKRQTYVRRGAGTVHILSPNFARTICGKIVGKLATNGKLVHGCHPWQKHPGPCGCRNCWRMRDADTA